MKYPQNLIPIALCNVIYKIISKVIANRLWPLLPFLISPEQAEFVVGRQILDGIILVHETIHSVKIGKILGMLLKLDLSKAYDKLNWKFLAGVLQAFGFSAQWTGWVMKLVSSSFCSILVNGTPSSPFQVSRRIKQGDPMSPFLFILEVEGLGRMLKNLHIDNNIKGISLNV